jgi:hypothetical protein
MAVKESKGKVDIQCDYTKKQGFELLRESSSK